MLLKPTIRFSTKLVHVLTGFYPFFYLKNKNVGIILFYSLPLLQVVFFFSLPTSEKLIIIAVGEK